MCMYLWRSSDLRETRWFSARTPSYCRSIEIYFTEAVYWEMPARILCSLAFGFSAVTFLLKEATGLDWARDGKPELLRTRSGSRDHSHVWLFDDAYAEPNPSAKHAGTFAMMKSLEKIWGSGLDLQFSTASTVHVTYTRSDKIMCDGVSNKVRVKSYSGNKVLMDTDDQTLVSLEKYLSKLMDYVLQNPQSSVPQYLALWPLKGQYYDLVKSEAQTTKEKQERKKKKQTWTMEILMPTTRITLILHANDAPPVLVQILLLEASQMILFVKLLVLWDSSTIRQRYH
eukprot:gnl/MRDRNA2_/MRDRNA2_353593_c0_seq1.p1 gnl/MRDRNA2_/MRDRNA2_353593_c0~~gnl/MRDRNA2_/MRDRNA2_353593_c0_seq1.p1  ORF type:complete len:285 (+),score=38.76 gnl/MRDRNA2_/MRDRNA2_353593_c0_seq1:106-960(+)